MKKVYRNGIYLLLVVIAVGIYYFNQKTFSKDNTYYGYFESVSGLETGSPVLLNGVKIGKVQSFDIVANGNVRVTLSVSKKILLPKGTLIRLVSSGGLFSSKLINVFPGNSKEIIADETTLSTESDPTIVESASAKIAPLIASAKVVLKGADSALTYFNYIIKSGLTAKAVQTMITLDSQSRSMSETAKEINSKSTAITKFIRTLHDGTKNLGGKKNGIDSTIHGAEKSTDALAKKDLQKSTGELNANLAKINKSLNTKKSDKPDNMYPNLKKGIDSLQGKMKTMQDKAAKAD